MEEERKQVTPPGLPTAQDPLPLEPQLEPLPLEPTVDPLPLTPQATPMPKETSFEPSPHNPPAEPAESATELEPAPTDPEKSKSPSAPDSGPSPANLSMDPPLRDSILASEKAFHQVETKVAEIAQTEQRMLSEVHEMHRLYHGEFAGRLRSMQEELDKYHKLDNGRAFDDILGEIARIYGNYNTLQDEVQDPKVKKHLRYLFMDLEDLLTTYNVGILHSAVGDKRNIRHCQVVNRIPTDDPAKHDTIVKSHNTGFFIENRTIIKELVDIWIYDASLSQTVTSETPVDNSGERPATE